MTWQSIRTKFNGIFKRITYANIEHRIQPEETKDIDVSDTTRRDGCRADKKENPTSQKEAKKVS